MTRLVWDDLDSRYFTSGVDRGVFVPLEGESIPWNGLISVDEATANTDVSTSYQDGRKYRNRHTPDGFEATISAYTYPDALEDRYKPFSFAYRTLVGDGVEGLDLGYRIHLVYNALAKPSQKEYSTVAADPEGLTFNWDISTTPIRIVDNLVGSHLIIDSTKAHPWTLAAFEDLLYGSDTQVAHIPAPIDVLNLFEENSVVKVTDLGNGIFSVEGPDEYVSMVNPTTFRVDWESAVWVDDVTYQLSSL